jgi:DNA-binding NtrC family response regulator
MPYRVLLVDDDSMVLKTLQSVFRTRNFDVSTAVSASEARSVLERDSFDLVVTDMRMESETSGFDVVRHTKSVQKHALAVILSAYPIPANEWREAGADAMFMKGGGIFRILDDIEKLLQTHAHK